MVVSDTPLERIQHLMELAAGPARKFAATELYNEEWMLRLILDWHEQNPGVESPLALPKGRSASWYSEGRLPTPFRVEHRGNALGEAHVRTNGVVGHLATNEGHADIRVAPKASHLVVVDARMASGLVESTRFGGKYDQAARTVACIAKALELAKRLPQDMDALAFCLVAPQVRVEAKVYRDLVTRKSVGERVEVRYNKYREAVSEPDEVDTWYKQWFKPVLKKISLEIVTWEQLIHEIRVAEASFGDGLDTFYHQALIHNRVHVRGKAKGRRSGDA